ncbi:DNA sulfur modification protein DndD [Azotobacter salinestris]|uniref:DNA sulfur modification protein DndD n=1 Tax=Azotobacter salinestris TaxID=69964 RepID=UPI0032DE857B
MILKNLYLQDFGVFAGSFEANAINLEPRVRYGHKRPIVLFGGLNGTGKTTTLTAVRLALYGRQALGQSVTHQAYHHFLREQIHRPREALLNPVAAGVKLDFDFGRQGQLIDYTVKRTWSVEGQGVTERLDIHQNGQLIKGLDEQHKQAFLNELIPIGVADLFFFDGEKIAELAEDDNNTALGEAIDRLFGLDVIKCLRADLDVYLRKQKQQKQPAEIQQEIQQLEASYESLQTQYQEKLLAMDNTRINLAELGKTREWLQCQINELGGDWASTRQGEQAKEKELHEKREGLQSRIRQLMSDAVPLSLARTQLAVLLEQLKAESQAKRQSLVDAELRKQLDRVKKALIRHLGDAHLEAIEASISNSSPKRQISRAEIIHDISDSELNRIQYLVTEKVPQQEAEIKALASELESVEEALASAGLRISRAPDEKHVAALISELSATENKLGQYQSQKKQQVEEARKTLREAMDCLRKLRDKEQEYDNHSNLGQSVELADKTRGLLDDFARQTRQQRITRLEQEFIKAFGKLARKDDLLIEARINLNPFSVELVDQQGRKVDKKKLSAGEKQIYAIAMLEALGRASGRNLPIIIDTPLGRLDSRHRENLVKNYFPIASHQVLILSTDTEVDEDFYKALSSEISHAFEVVYDPEAGSSSYREGYFWRH